MAEPVKFDYQNPENVEAEVPGTQKIREVLSNETGESLPNYCENSPNNGETASNNGVTTSQINENPKVSNENLEVATNDDFSLEPVIVVTKKEATFTKGDLKLQKITVTEDISVKYQHLFKKETMPGKTVVTQENPENGEVITTPHSVHPEVTEEGRVITRHRQDFGRKRNGIHGEPVMLDKHVEEKKTRTKIPVSRFKQTVEKVKNERRRAKEKREHESNIPVRRSSIPKPMKEQKLPTTTVKKEITITKTEISKESPDPVINKIVVNKESSEPKYNEITEPEDEFDKIYAEVVDSPTELVLDDSLLNPKVEDPEKLESKFEEIIHDYDEHKVEPIDVEVVRRSKIPFLKRKGQQETELSAQAERTSKIIAARDKLRLRSSSTTSENFEDELDKELKDTQDNLDAEPSNVSNEKAPPAIETKSEKEITHEIISSPDSKTETVREFTKTVSTTSSKENENVETVVEIITVTEVTTDENNDKRINKQQQFTEENIIKDSIKIGIPVFNSQIDELVDKNETSKTVEVKRVLSYTSQNEDLSATNNISEIKNEDKETNVETVDKSFERQASETKTIAKEADTTTNNINDESVKNIDTDRVITKDHDQKAKELNLMKEIQLRGKVERVNSKIDSKEVIETEGNKRESINELRKKKSVLSKIAMFEKKEIEKPIPNRGLRKEIKLPKLITKDWQKVEHVHVHTPLIVDEVFKPFKNDISLSEEGNKGESPLNSDSKYTTIVRAERVTVQTPDSVHYAAENLVQIESNRVQENNLIEETIAPQVNIDSEYTIQKVEIATITDVLPSKGLTITNDIPSPTKVLDKQEAEDFQIKRGSNTKLNMTKELHAPVVIPGFKPVSELLRGFESKKDANKTAPKRTVSKVEYSSTVLETPVKIPEVIPANESKALATEITQRQSNNNESYDDFEAVNEYTSLDDVFSKDNDFSKLKLKHEDDMRRAKSLAELDLGDAVKGKVNNIILRMKSVDRIELDRKEVINKKEMPRKRSVSEKIALFEGFSPSRSESPLPLRIFKSDKPTEVPRIEKKMERVQSRTELANQHSRIDIQRERNITERTEKIVADTERSNKSDEEVIQKKIEELINAKTKYGKIENMPGIELSNGQLMPALAVGTALLNPRLIFHIVSAAIDLGYRAIDSAYIYGTEKEVGEAIKAKIADGTVKREDLFVISKLWSTYHRSDLVEKACRASLEAMGLDYFDLYLIHNPMSFKEGGAPIPKIATVIQYSEHDYMDAWYGMERLVIKNLVRAIGVSNFNSVQLQRVLDKGRIKPVINQVECHPYLSQQRLDLFCSERNVTLSCFGVLGSKGTPLELKSGQPAVIDDALVQVMASGLGVTPAQLLISYQLENGHGVVVKASSAAHLWDNLRALDVHLTMGQVDALHALNRNKRMFTFKGMGDTHKNYPFNIAF